MGKDEFKLGQTKELNPTAADSEALTTFYSTLYKQRPDSEMAARFLLQHGLLPDEDLQKVYKKYGKGAGASSSKSGARCSPSYPVQRRGAGCGGAAQGEGALGPAPTGGGGGARALARDDAEEAGGDAAARRAGAAPPPPSVPVPSQRF